MKTSLAFDFRALTDIEVVLIHRTFFSMQMGHQIRRGSPQLTRICVMRFFRRAHFAQALELYRFTLIGEITP